MNIQLNEGQEILLDKLTHWYHDYENKIRTQDHPQYFSYSGAAGTGKTTVVREFIDRLGLTDDEFICCAYVGKAVLQLQRHDLPACTVHSLIYDVMLIKVPKLLDGEEVTDYNGDTVYKLELRFSLKEHLREGLKLIIVDEATMINDDMRDKLLSFGLPIIFIGDMNQLPPIFGYSSVMLRPDYVLSQIMRQLEDDPIVILSQNVLHNIPFELGIYGKSKIIDHFEVNQALIRDYDMILCGKNHTRDQLNDMILDKVFRRKNKIPFIGAKMVNRQNNWDYMIDGIALTNGLIGYITNFERRSSNKGYYKIDFRPDFMESEFEGLKLDVKYLNCNAEERKNFGMSRYEKFEYAYAITTHISQGSEFDNVLYIDEQFWSNEMTQKLRYTAITRAKDSITIVVSRPRNRYWSGVNKYD